jgi:MoxR-like ATPase
MMSDGERREIDAADPIYTPSQLHNALVPLIRAKLPVLVTGQPGQGKTDIITQVCEELGYDLLITHPVVDEPIDYKGHRQGRRAARGLYPVR